MITIVAIPTTKIMTSVHTWRLNGHWSKVALCSSIDHGSRILGSIKVLDRGLRKRMHFLS